MPGRLTQIFGRSVLALLLVGLLCLSGCGDSEGAGDDEQAAAEATEAAEAGERTEGDQEEGEKTGSDGADKEREKKPRKERTTSVSASAVIRGDLVIPVVAEGSVRARNQTEINFEIGGRVTRVWVREGQRVRRGQTLVSLDDREYQLALEEANARYLKALGQLAVEEEGYDSEPAERGLAEQLAELNRMEKEGLITRDEKLDRELELGMQAVRNGAYRRELLEVRSGLAAARADVTRAKLNIERALLEAPFSGVITGLDLQPGERVQPGESLCRLVDDVNIEAEVGVLESDLGAVAVGRAAFLDIPALGENFPVQVDVVSPDVDLTSRTCNILMRLKSQGRVKPGMFVRASIAGKVLEDRLLVPKAAILTRDGRPVLFRVEKNRAKWVYVKLGERNEHVVEIKRVDQGGPLEPGTLVVVDNHLTLSHDAKIKVKKKLPIEDPWATETDDEQG